MKLLSRFRRKPPPLTAAQGKELAKRLAEQIFADLRGFMIAAVEEPGTGKGDVAAHLHVSGQGIYAGLAETLRFLLLNPETKDAAAAAIFAALQQSGAARTVQIGGCDCPVCIARGETEEETATSKPH